MQERAIETRNNILKSAITVFAEKGLNGATIDDIAEAAGANKQRIYAYFGSKQKLFEAALVEVFHQVELFSRTTMEEAAANPQRMTAILLDGFIRVHAAQPELWRLLAWANLEGKSCVQALAQVRKEENEFLRQLFEKTVQNGYIKDISFESYLFTLLATSCFLYSNRLSLAYSIHVDFTEEWNIQLCKDLNNVFQQHKEN